MRTRSIIAAVLLFGMYCSPVWGKPEKQFSWDARAEMLMRNYAALSDKAKIGPDGTKIIEELKSFPRVLSPTTQSVVDVLLTVHNLLVLCEANGKAVDPLKKGKKDEKLVEPIGPVVPLEQPRVKWEYNVLSETEIRTLGKGELKAGLNLLGNDHWELVSIFQRSARVPEYFFKRPVPQKRALLPEALPRDTGEAIGKEIKQLNSDLVSELLETKGDEKRLKETEARWKPKIDALKARYDKLSDEEKRNADRAAGFPIGVLKSEEKNSDRNRGGAQKILDLQNEVARLQCRELRNALNMYQLRNKGELPKNWNDLTSGDVPILEKGTRFEDPWGNLYHFDSEPDTGAPRVWSKGPPGGTKIK